METITRNIISFYELDEKWQAEAVDNLGGSAEDCQFLEPDKNHVPEVHILWDLSECMINKGNFEGFEYNCTIGLTNNSGMLLNISDCGEVAEFIII